MTSLSAALRDLQEGFLSLYGQHHAVGSDLVHALPEDRQRADFGLASSMHASTCVIHIEVQRITYCRGLNNSKRVVRPIIL